MELQIFEASNGPCPYLENRQWHTYMFKARVLEGAVYETLIEHGFRRSGIYFYRNNCPGCQACRSIRLPVDRFTPSKSQRRTYKKNRDVSVVLQPVEFDLESYHLYRRYSLWKHDSETGDKNYIDFLVRSAVDTLMMKYFIGSRLVGIGWIDHLPQSLSSVYFAFDPSCHRRSLGVFSILKELELARQLNKSYLHLGFWIRDCQAMSYKQQLRPIELLGVDGKWMDGETELADSTLAYP